MQNANSLVQNYALMPFSYWRLNNMFIELSFHQTVDMENANEMEWLFQNGICLIITW